MLLSLYRFTSYVALSAVLLLFVGRIRQGRRFGADECPEPHGEDESCEACYEHALVSLGSLLGVLAVVLSALSAVISFF